MGRVVPLMSRGKDLAEREGPGGAGTCWLGKFGEGRGLRG